MVEQRSFGMMVTISPPPSPNLLNLTALENSVILLILIPEIEVFEPV